MKSYRGVVQGRNCDFDFTKFQRYATFIDFECTIYSIDSSFDVWKINAKATPDGFDFTTEFFPPPDNSRWAYPCKFIFNLGMFEDRSLGLDGYFLHGPVRLRIFGKLERY